jgi:carbon storage regulator
MLVLTRKVGERIVIDGGIIVVVSRIDPHRVAIGIEAPRAVGIHRGEIEARKTPPASAQGTREQSTPANFV